MKKILILVALCLIVNVNAQKSQKKTITTKKESQIQLIKEDDIISFMWLHNDARKSKGCPELTYDKELSKYAQKWADSLQRIGDIKHRPQCPYGENIYWHSNTTLDDFSISYAAESWYNEKKYDKNGIVNNESGHYTQMIWKKSKKVGVGLSVGKNGIFVVANYDPPGNNINEKAY